MQNLEEYVQSELECRSINDRLLVVYYNLLAQAYERLNRGDDRMRMLRSSAKILPNPRNSANWNLLAKKLVKLRMYLKWGSGLSIVAFVVAFFFIQICCDQHYYSKIIVIMIFFII